MLKRRGLPGIKEARLPVYRTNALPTHCTNTPPSNLHLKTKQTLSLEEKVEESHSQFRTLELICNATNMGKSRVTEMAQRSGDIA